MLNRFLTKSILIFFGETAQMSQNPVFISQISFEMTKINFQGGKSLQRTFSLSPVSFSLKKLHFIILKNEKKNSKILSRTNNSRSRCELQHQFLFQIWPVSYFLLPIKVELVTKSNVGYRKDKLVTSILQKYCPLIVNLSNFRGFCSESCKRKS